jgi:drug/metabolite transporter (DMT)-like permease
MSRVLLRQRHSMNEYCCAFLLALGMFIVLVGQPTSDLKRKNFELDRGNRSSVPTGHERSAGHRGLISGLIILGLYLTFDSFTSNWQQSLYTQYDISNWQMMAAINFYSILLTLTSLHQLGSLRPTLKMLASSTSLLTDCLTMSVMSSIGQMFVYYTIKRFGSVLFAVIMTFRQLLSILISVLVFGHNIAFGSLFGLALVFLVSGYQINQKLRRGNKKGVPDEHAGWGIAARSNNNM